MKCPKCGFEQSDRHIECTRCGLVFSKFEAIQKKKDQVNSRYSPQAQEAAEGPEEAVTDKTGPLEPKPEAITAAQLQEVRTQIQRLHLGVQSTLKYQESLSGELQAQRGMVRELFTQLGAFQNQVDQKVLALQGQLQTLAETQQTLGEKVVHAEPIEEMREGLTDLATRLDKLIAGHKEPRWVKEMKPRVEKLESLQEQLRTAMKQKPGSGAAEGLAAHEALMIKSEVQALRSEVRHLLEQSIAPAPEAAPAAAAPSTEVFKDIEDRIHKVQQSITQHAEVARKEQEAARKQVEPLLPRIQEAEGKISSLLAQKEFWLGLTEEISQLQQSFQTFQEAIRSELAQQYQLIQQSSRDLSDQQAAVSEIHGILQRVRQAIHPE